MADNPFENTKEALRHVLDTVDDYRRHCEKFCRCDYHEQLRASKMDRAFLVKRLDVIKQAIARIDDNLKP